MITLYVDDLLPNDDGGMTTDKRSVFYNRDLLQKLGKCLSLPELCIVGRFICIGVTTDVGISQIFWNYKGGANVYDVMNLTTDTVVRNSIFEIYMKASENALVHSPIEEVELVKGLPPSESNN